ncbi:MAG: hypothetical protein MI924_24195 [Chloroflexales bacterium]|nr:hypothetical protein [Chloroflexales bacterium]
MNSITVLANAQCFFFDGNYETLEDAIHAEVAALNLPHKEAERLIEDAIADIPDLESEA